MHFLKWHPISWNVGNRSLESFPSHFIFFCHNFFPKIKVHVIDSNDMGDMLVIVRRKMKILTRDVDFISLEAFFVVIKTLRQIFDVMPDVFLLRPLVE